MRALKWLLVLLIVGALGYGGWRLQAGKTDAAALAKPLSPAEVAAEAPLLRAVQDWQQARYASSNALNKAAVDGMNARNAGSDEDSRRQALESSLVYVRSLEKMATLAGRVARLADEWRKQGHPGAGLLVEAMASTTRNDAAEAASPPYVDNALQRLPPKLEVDARFSASRTAIAEVVAAVRKLADDTPAAAATGGAPLPVDAVARFHARVLANGPFGSSTASSDIAGSAAPHMFVAQCQTVFELKPAPEPDEARAFLTRTSQSCQNAASEEMVTKLLLTRALSADVMELESTAQAQDCQNKDGSACKFSQDGGGAVGRLGLASEQVLVLELGPTSKAHYAIVTRH